MPMTDFAPLWYPPAPQSHNQTPPLVHTFHTMNASGDRVAYVFQVPKSGTLDWFECNIGVNNNPDNGLRFSFQDVSLSTGLPDGSADQFRDVTSVAFGWNTPPGVMTNDGTNGGTKRSVTKGDWLALVVDFVSFTAGDSVDIHGITGHQRNFYSYFIADGSSGSYVKTSQNYPSFALKYADGTYAKFTSAWIVPVTQIIGAGLQITNASTYNALAVKLALPATVRAAGMWLQGDIDGVCDVTLYDASDTVIDTITLDPDVRLQTSAAFHTVDWPNGPHTLPGGTFYRVALSSQDATGGNVFQLVAPSAALLDETFPCGSDAISSRRQGSTWEDLSAQCPMMGLIIDGIHLTNRFVAR